MARTEEAVRAPSPPRPPTTNGQGRGRVEQVAPAPAAPRKSRVPRPPGWPMLIAAALLVVMLGALYFQDQSLYVSTDNALVTGAVVQLGSPSAGQIRSVTVEVGDEVARGQVVATVALAPPQNQPQAPITQSAVRSPINGIVAARYGNPGEPVTNGRTILTVMDPNSVWVQAQIDETVVGRIRPGQPVEIVLNSLGQMHTGRVNSVGAASSATGSQILTGANAGGPQRIGQIVPVRIDLDDADLPLVLGSTASVKIRVQS